MQPLKRYQRTVYGNIRAWHCQRCFLGVELVRGCTNPQKMHGRGPDWVNIYWNLSEGLSLGERLRWMIVIFNSCFFLRLILLQLASIAVLTGAWWHFVAGTGIRSPWLVDRQQSPVGRRRPVQSRARPEGGSVRSQTRRAQPADLCQHPQPVVYHWSQEWNEHIYLCFAFHL